MDAGAAEGAVEGASSAPGRPRHHHDRHHHHRHHRRHRHDDDGHGHARSGNSSSGSGTANHAHRRRRREPRDPSAAPRRASISPASPRADDYAASSPVVRTAPHKSSLASLGSAGLRSLMRPASVDSLGSLAVEPAPAKSLMLADRLLDRRRVSAGAVGGPSVAPGTPPVRDEASDRSLSSPRPIPARDSSLRASRRKQAAAARHRERDNDTIPEADEGGRQHRAADATFLTVDDELPMPSAATKAQPRDGDGDEPAYDDSAPYPSVSSGRRRDDDSSERSSSRLSGRQSPGPRDAFKMRRSSSRLARLSAGPLTPRSDSRASVASPDAQQQQRQQQQQNHQHHHQHHPVPAGYERPDSADSVDDAVESYLCSPRLSQKIRHPQTGRLISFSEVGDANGSAVFCCVGMGLTRYVTAFYDDLDLTLKLRLITPDRPGVGDSEPYADGTATPLSWPDDVYAIFQALKITKFSILAHSAGAIYALATALCMPQHIRGRIHLAPWIPPSQMNVFGSSHMTPPTNAIPTSQKILRALPKGGQLELHDGHEQLHHQLAAKERAAHAAPGGRAGCDDAAAAPGAPDSPPAHDGMRPLDRGAMAGGSGVLAAAASVAADKERQTTYDMRLTHAIWELATTGANPAVDLLVCFERRHTIGFRYVDITRPVVIHHGSRDTRVPVDNVRWLGKTMRRCEVRVLEGEGHGLMASAAVMGSVLISMSKEWEDWMRATGADGRRDRDRGRRGR